MSENEPAAAYTDVVQDFYRAVGDKDSAAIAHLVREHFAEDAALVLPASLPYGGTFTGAAKLGRMFGRMAASPEPVGAAKVVVVDIIDGGDRIAARLEFDWYAPGSRSFVRTGAIEVWTFKGGLVAEIRAYYWDTAACAAQVAAATG